MLSIENPTDAKQFLLVRLLQQAQRDGTALSEVEKRMFLFSEVSGETDWDANERFEAEYDTKEYEARISKLLRRSFAQDKQDPEARADWDAALAALRNEDFYGLVMVDQAGIRRPKPSPLAVLRAITQGFLLATNPKFILAKGIIAVLGFLLLLDPFHWGLVIGDLAKWLCAGVVVMMIWTLSWLEKALLSRNARNLRPEE